MGDEVDRGDCEVMRGDGAVAVEHGNDSSNGR